MTPQSQPKHLTNNSNDHRHVVNEISMLSMTSIGFGIDSSPAAGYGDATQAAVKAVLDAMERSSLRLPISSPARNLLQLKIKLGVPAKQYGSGPMAVNMDRLSSCLPQVIPVLPIQVSIGGLFLPSEFDGASSICTATACITLQSQPSALTVPPTRVSTSTSPTQTPTALSQHSSAQGNRVVTSSQDPAIPTRISETHPPAASSNCSPTISQSNSEAVADCSPSLCHSSLHHLNHLATAAASSPPHPASTTSPARAVSAPSQQNHVMQEPAQPPQRGNTDVPRSTSMELLAMISEHIRNNKVSAAMPRSHSIQSAQRIGGGLATAAVEGQNHAPATATTTTTTAPGASLDCHNGHVTNGIGRLKEADNATFATTILSEPGSGSNMGLSSYTTMAGDECAEGDLRDGALSNYTMYKKLPPGVTTKNNQRLFVKHRYLDFSSEMPRAEEQDHDIIHNNSTGSIKIPPATFPVKLHETLLQIEQDSLGDIIGWLPHGRSFKIHKQQEFADIILPKYFIMTKKSSFLRQLNLYGFNRFSAGPDQGSYYHEKFLRGLKFLCRRMIRQKVNGNRIRSAGNPDEEPNLALYPVCPPTQASMSAYEKRPVDLNRDHALLLALSATGSGAPLPTKKRTQLPLSQTETHKEEAKKLKKDPHESDQGEEVEEEEEEDEKRIWIL